MGAWFIPITVTVAGTIAGWINGKLTEGVSFFPGKDPTPRDTTVRIWAGMTRLRNDSAEASTGGFMPHVILYDERGDMVGISCGRRKMVKEGNFQDFKIPARKGNNARPAYLELTGCK